MSYTAKDISKRRNELANAGNNNAEISNENSRYSTESISARRKQLSGGAVNSFEQIAVDDRNRRLMRLAEEYTARQSATEPSRPQAYDDEYKKRVDQALAAYNINRLQRELGDIPKAGPAPKKESGYRYVADIDADLASVDKERSEIQNKVKELAYQATNRRGDLEGLNALMDKQKVLKAEQDAIDAREAALEREKLSATGGTLDGKPVDYAKAVPGSAVYSDSYREKFNREGLDNNDIFKAVMKPVAGGEETPVDVYRSLGNSANDADKIAAYNAMTPREEAVYRGLYYNASPEEAERYLGSITEELNRRVAEGKYEDIKDNGLKKSISVFDAGVSSGVRGAANVPSMVIGDTRRKPNTVSDQLSEMIRQNAETDISRAWYDILSSTGNMAPGLVLSPILGPAGGNFVFGASQAGNAYREAINEGRSVRKAQAYAAQQGVDEWVTNALLGGIGAFGGGDVKPWLKNTRIGKAMVSGFDSMFTDPAKRAVAGVIADYLTDAGSEAAQEFTQYFTEGITRAVLFDEKLDLNDPNTWKEAGYSALLGALNAGILNLPTAAMNIPEVKQYYAGDLKGIDYRASVYPKAASEVYKKHAESAGAGSYGDIVTYDEAMRKAYMAGVNGESLESIVKSDADFASFYDNHSDAVTDMMKAGVAATTGAQAEAHFEDSDFSEETIQKNIDTIRNGKSIVTVSDTIEPDENGKHTKAIKEYFDKAGRIVHNPVIGDVTIANSGIKHTIAKGVYPNKIASFKAVRDVIEKGQIVNAEKNWKSRSYDSVVIASKVTLGDQDCLMGVVVKRQPAKKGYSSQTYDVHEVIIIGDRSQNGPNENPESVSKSPLINILEKIADSVNVFRNKTAVSQAVADTVEQRTDLAAPGLERLSEYGNKAASVANEYYDGGDPADYSEYMGMAYEAGRSGQELGAITDRDFNDFRKTLPEAIDAMYKAGMEDANESSNRNEGRKAGVDGLLEGSGIQEERSERGETQRERGLRTKAAALAQGGTREVNASDIVPSGASSEATVLTDEFVKADEALSKIATDNASHGIKTTFILGNIGVNENGFIIPARGCNDEDGKHIVVRVDHPVWSPEQINAHERFHSEVKGDAGLLDDILNRMLAEYSKDEINAMMSRYAEAYELIGADAEYIFEELCADIYAGMDIFEGKLTALAPYVNEAVQESKGKANTARGPPRSDDISMLSRETPGQLSIEDLEKQLGLNLENQTPAQRELSAKALRTTTSLRDSKGKPVTKGAALTITKELLESGKTELIGKTAKTPADMAAIAQVYRDPRYETLRYFFTDKNGKIVFQTGVSAHLPATTFIYPTSENFGEYMTRLVNAAKDAGAENVYMLHNHPSGVVTPSQEDLNASMHMKKMFAIGGLALKGSLVIDHTEYANIDVSGENARVGVHNLPKRAINDMGKTYDPSVRNPILGMMVTKPDDIKSVAMAEKLGERKRKETVSLFFTDTKLRVRVIQECGTEYAKDTTKLLRHIRKTGTDYGCNAIFAVTGDKETFSGPVRELGEQGILLDAVLMEGVNRPAFWCLSEDYGITPGRIFNDENYKGVRVGDAKFSRDIDEESIVDAKKKGVSIEGGAATKFSRDTWDSTDKEELLQDLVDAGFEETEAQKWIDDVSSVSAIIAMNPNLDYTAGKGTWLKNNAETIKSLDGSFLCPKKSLFQGTYNAIAKRIPWLALDAKEYIALKNLLKSKGYEVPCTYCYNESRQQGIGTYAKEFLDQYKGGYKLQAIDLTTTEGMARLEIDHPEIFADWLRFRQRAHGAQRSVKFEANNIAYTRADIMSMSAEDRRAIMAEGGLRWFAFSDFKTEQMIDAMQAVLDLSAMNMRSYAYTKQADFVRVFGDTGILINMSVAGRVKNGELVFDNVDGMNFDTALALRETHSKTAGLTLVGVSDEHVRLAMADSRIDMIMPFHRSGLTNEDMKNLGISDYTDYQQRGSQNEHWVRDGKVCGKNLLLRDYWSDTKSGKENAERYLKECKRTGRIPKFPEFLDKRVDSKGQVYYALKEDGSTDGYWKLLPDFKMYDNEGNNIIQREVTPNFDMDAARDILENYDGNGDQLPVAEDVVDEFVKEYKKKSKFSRDTEGRSLSKGQQEYFKDSKIRDEEGNLVRAYHGTSEEFTVFDRTKGRSAMDIQGSFFSPWSIDAEGYGPNVKTVYLNITNPAPESVAYKALNRFKGQNDAGVKAREYLISLGYDGVNNSDEEYIAFYPEQAKDINNLNPSSNPDIRFSRDVPEGDAEHRFSARWEAIPERKKKVSKALQKRDRGEMLSESQFYQVYAAHKLDLRKKGNVQAQVENIKKEGFKGDGGFGHNIVNSSINPIGYTEDDMLKNGYTQHNIDWKKENQKDYWVDGRYYPSINVVQGAYGARKGDTVMFVPYDDLDRGGDRVKPGYIPPFDFEFVTVERTFQPYYELYKKAYEEHVKSNGLETRFSRDTDQAFTESFAEAASAIKGMKASANAAGKVIAKSIKDFNAKDVDKAKLTADLDKVYSRLSEGKVSPEKALDELRKIAGEIFGHQGAERVPSAYDMFKGYFKKTRLYVNDTIKGDIADYNEWRKRNIGYLTLVNDPNATGVDSYYTELSGMYPGVFPDDITNPTDQLERILEVAKLAKEGMWEDAFAEMTEEDYEHELSYIALKLLKGFTGEKVEAGSSQEVSKLNKRIEYLEKQLAGMRDYYHKRIDEEIAKRLEYREKEALKKFEKEARQKLLKEARKLARKKGDPDFRAEVDKLIGNLDLVAVGIRQDTEAVLENLRDEVERLAAEDPDYAILEKPRWEALYNRIRKMHIRDMDIEDVIKLTEQIVAMRHEQEVKDRQIKDDLGEKTATMGRRAVRQQENVRKMHMRGRFWNNLRKYALYMESPQRAGAMLDGYQKDGVYSEHMKAINDGQTKGMTFRMNAQKRFDKVLTDSLVKDWSKNNIEITDAYGRKAMISKGMRLALYLHAKNGQNLAHIGYSGLTVPGETDYRKGDYGNAYGSTGTRLQFTTEAEKKGRSDEAAWERKIRSLAKKRIDAITASMSAEEKAFADAAYKFFNEDCKKAINETSLLLNGYEKAVVDNYFPIRTDPNFTQKDASGLALDGTIEGMGMLKERKEGASNPILLEDIAQVIQRQTNNVAKYYGLAIPVRNFNKFMNYQSTGYAASTREATTSAWRTEGMKYVEDFLKDIQTGRDYDGTILDRFKSLYAGVTLNLNLGVSIKQSASAPFAAVILDAPSVAKAFAKNLFSKADLDYMDSITPWGWSRRQGMSGTEIGEVYRQKNLIDQNKAFQKLKEKFNWIQDVDVWTTNRLFFATEYYVQEHFPEIAKQGRGSEAYDAKVAEVYNEVLQRTQPSYDVMQRNAILRSRSDLTKLIGMFKTQTFNMGGEIIDSYARLKATDDLYKMGEATKTDKAEAHKQFGKTIIMTMVSQGMLVTLSAIANAILHRMKPYRDDKGEVTAESLISRMLYEWNTSYAGLVAGGSELQQALLYFTGREKWYDITYPGIDLVNELVSDIGKTFAAVGTEKFQTRAAALAMSIARMFKVPSTNIYNMLNALNLHLQDYREGALGSFDAGAGLLGLRDTSVTKEQYANRAVDAYSNGDTEKGDKALLNTNKASLEKALGSKIPQSVYNRFLEDGVNAENYIRYVEKGEEPKLSDVKDQGYSSVNKLYEAAGDPERNENWHHIVEQEQGDKSLAGFRQEEIQNFNNIVSLPSGSKSVHTAITKYYNSTQDFTGGKSVRSWLSEKSFEEQWEFGMEQLRKYGDVIPTSNGWVFIPDNDKIDELIPQNEGTGAPETPASKLTAELKEKGLSGNSAYSYVIRSVQDKTITAADAEEWYESNAQRTNSPLFKSWKDLGKSTFEFIKHKDDIARLDEKYERDEKARRIGNYIKQNVKSRKEQEILWQMAGFSLYKNDGKTYTESFRKNVLSR